jgi:P27 family predicted phage terminase small subunit
MAGKSSNRPEMPDDLEGEALLEWDRVCAELEKQGRLDQADRSVITIYCHTWATYKAAQRNTFEHGAVVKFPNGIPGQSPHYKTMKELANILRLMLADLGLTPAARGKSKEQPTDELNF